MTEHVHEWQRTGVTEPHFRNEPNSRRQHMNVHRLICACGYRGFRYVGYSRVVYTWNPADALEEV